VANISRNSFQETQNALNDLRGLVPSAQEHPKHYVSLRIQQGVPVLDADLNELEDIRRIEVETLLVNAIGNGVPAGSDGFKIGQANDTAGNFSIAAGLILFDGWLVYNPKLVDYVLQPYRNDSGVSPSLPVPVPNAPVARRELVYLDAWEREVGSVQHSQLIDPRIGIETAVRLERIWVVRMAPIAAEDDPLDPATIPDRQTGHRYYPLATVDRQAGAQITAAMITDIRRTHLTLEALTYAPLLIDDAARQQRLDSARLAATFRRNRRVLGHLLSNTPEMFIFSGNETATWQSMTAYQDVRATATTFEHQANRQLLHQQAALEAMAELFAVQMALVEKLQDFVDAGIGGAKTESFVETCEEHLKGSGPADTTSLEYALTESDVLGAVLAQERLNEELSETTDDLPEGSVSASLIAIAPPGPLQPRTVCEYLLTIRIQSNLFSQQGSEPIRAIVSASAGWELSFEGSAETDKREIVVVVQNQMTLEVVLRIAADEAAPDTSFNLNVRPERRQQRVYIHNPVPMALGQELLPSGGAIASFAYGGVPPLKPGNIAQVAKNVMTGGVSLSFDVTNLSGTEEQFQVTITAQGADTGWQQPNQPALAPIQPGGHRPVSILFKTDQPDAASPLTYRLQLKRVTGGASDLLPYTTFDLTFELQ
jgi:hypothetical protein